MVVKTIIMQFVYVCIASKMGEHRGEQHVVRQPVPVESMPMIDVVKARGQLLENR